MALSDTTIKTRVRHLLQDTIDGAYRWTETELGNWIADGAREIARIRPNAIVGYQSGAVNCTLPSDSSTINEVYGDALINYVCYRALSKDGEDGSPEQAVAYHNLFRQSLGLK